MSQSQENQVDLQKQNPISISLGADNDQNQDIVISRTDSETKQEIIKEDHKRQKIKQEQSQNKQEKIINNFVKGSEGSQKEQNVDIETRDFDETIPQLNQIANIDMFYEQDHIIGEIHIRITGNAQRGSTLSKYTTYLIIGEDAKGKYELARRYSEFDALRTLLKDRWPGLFIPSLPDKNLTKNSPQTIAERQRLLDNFLKKIAFNKNLYYGDEVQLFLRSGQTDITSTIQKQPKHSLQQIINKYKSTFDDLSGKQINSGSTIKISTFKTVLKKIQIQLPQMADAILNLAEAKDALNSKLSGLTGIIKDYEINTIAQFAQGNTKKLVYTNADNLQLQNQQQVFTKTSEKNPFWFLNDLVKIELKDSISFVQTIELIDKYNNKRLSCENDIKSLQRQIQQLALGNSTVSSMTTRKSKQQVKKGLEEKNKKLIQEKHHLIELLDMITAIISYNEIDNYKLLKRQYYSNLLKKVSGYEAFTVVALQQAWITVFEQVDLIKSTE